MTAIEDRPTTRAMLAQSSDAASRTAAREASNRVKRASRATLAWLATIVFVLPIYLAVSNTFKPRQEILDNPLGLPINPTLENLAKAWGRDDHLIQNGLLNSLLVTALTVVLIIPISSAVSFWISERTPKVKGVLLAIFALGLMIPPQVVLQPIIEILQVVHLDHSYPGLILQNVGGGLMSFAVFVYVGFLRTVPKEIIEAARVDGASEFRTWWAVVFPLVRPATATVGIFIGLWVWNDFLNPVYILGALQGQTITAGIYASLGTYSSDYGQLFGIMFLAALVPIVGYLATQREFIAGLMSGAAKG
ncbi:MAG TPA: carbohydrate ABC transporter permease [Candidatus Lumbricidophila sp.]|nr:carbohydrate ABC transporter permease [Candidatus Lumbricidophila sp.]